MVCDRSFELNLDCQASVVLTMLSNFFKPIILQRRFCAIAGVLGGLLLTQAVNYSTTRAASTTPRSSRKVVTSVDLLFSDRIQFS
jgi:hypothetical protein